MTRKCALCKEINYKRNKYSFFSAPKDAETRKKWQAALNIKNYTVTDDTYVCSKHFQKSDIITHWVSGIPPQVIKIKYKKCRLRPEAVPSRNFCSVTSSQVVDKHALNKYENKSENKHLLEKNKTFHRKNKNTINCNEDIENENINTCHHTSKSQDYICNYEESDESCIFQSLKDLDEKDVGTHDSKLENSEFERKILAEICEEDNDNNPCLDFTESINSMNVGEEGNQMYDKSFCAKTFKTVDYDIKRHDSTKKNDTIAVTWKHNTPSTDSSLKENTINNRLKINDSYIDDQVTTLNYNHLDMQNKEPYDGINEDELLFEDFLEICTEIVIPSNWSCLVTSKGYGTTVVYLCMSITN
ncbi:PREDICTED: uncharacterized protein LOC105560705 isoform X2 [Vollenhovia emeryi]|uniref:uncharacterized protein LOC105560705 isoform X2 n=1 Tax=Vollenhovia emeryi TaxID=411798 RepID=UPI0005F3DC99|nr:PREDICTED: uncharacterized protein LOC105560705 isoform X2 [Vollenhovia emeryi]